jgi:hypothetical protein
MKNDTNTDLSKTETSQVWVLKFSDKEYTSLYSYSVSEKSRNPKFNVVCNTYIFYQSTLTVIIT